MKPKQKSYLLTKIFTYGRWTLQSGTFFKPWLINLREEQNLVCIIISAIAETRKNFGNDAFHKDDFVKAICLYTEGIEFRCKDEDLNAKLYNNRASAHYHLGKVSFT